LIKMFYHFHQLGATTAIGLWVYCWCFCCVVVIVVVVDVTVVNVVVVEPATFCQCGLHSITG